MERNFISPPSNFQHMEGNSVDFNKTFDLNGTDNDEMLRLYLRKAGLSDEIECLAPEQRRAFIYDIIKSNKLPGYWVPSTMRTTPFIQAPLDVFSAPPIRMETCSAIIETSSSTQDYGTLKTSSLSNKDQRSPMMPHRFVQPLKPPPTPATFASGKKSMKYEISGPVNFAHVSGDMTRDMTRNAFDLTLTMNDNVLKKYLIERGIKEADICGMRKQDLIKNIVQSKYTWMPSRPALYIKQDFKAEDTTESKPRASTSVESFSLVNGRFSEPSTAPTTPSSTRKYPFSNYPLISSRFADPAQFPSPNSLYKASHESNLLIVHLPSLAPQAIRPAPPPRNSKFMRKNIQSTPPPPSSIKATINTSSGSEEDLYKSAKKLENSYANAFKDESRVPIVALEGDPRVNKKTILPPPPLLPPLPFPLPEQKYFEAPIGQSLTPPETHVNQNFAHLSERETTNVSDPRNKFLESIRNSITLKEYANPKKLNLVVAPTPPVQEPSKSLEVPFPPILSSEPGAAPQPPPQPPMKISEKCSALSPYPPLSSIEKTSSGMPLPPPDPRKPNLDIESNSRDALLHSIRQGIALKKVDQKAATISGVKPKVERKPPATDFLTELKLGITLRRVKNPTFNPFSDNDPDESNA